MNLCFQEPFHCSVGNKSSRVRESGPDSSKSRRAIESDPFLLTESTNRSEPTTNELSTDPKIEEALRPAALLSDSHPNSPHQEGKGLSDEDDPSKDNREEERPLALQLLAFLSFELIMGDLLESSLTSISHAEVDDGSSSGSFSEGFNAQHCLFRISVQKHVPK